VIPTTSRPLFLRRRQWQWRTLLGVVVLVFLAGALGMLGLFWWSLP